MATRVGELTSTLRGATARRTEPDGRPRLLIAQVADGLTLLAIFFAPMLKLGVGGGTVSDILLLLVIAMRSVQFCGPGLDLTEIRRHAFLLTLLGIYAVSGFVSGLVNNIPGWGEHLLAIYASLGSVFVVATYIRGEATLRSLIKWFALGTATLAASALVLPAEGSVGRATGLSTHPNFLGHSSITGFCAAAYLYENSKTPWARRGWVLCAMLTGLAIVRCGSRGAFLGIAFAGLLYLVLTRDRRYILIAVTVLWLGVVSIGAGVVKLPASNPIARFTSADISTQGSNKEREERLSEALDKVQQDPVFGTGSTGLVAIHVVYLQAWVGAGFVGAFVIIFLGGVMGVLPLFQPRRTLWLACGACAVAIAWAFTNLLGIRDQWLFLAVVFRMCQSPLQALNHGADTPRPVPRRTRHHLPRST
jgi:O-antigen ligase